MVADEQMAAAQAGYYRRQQHRYLGSFLACSVGLAVVVAWLLLAKPADGWFGLPVALVGVPCAFGVLVLGLLLVVTSGRAWLEALRRRRKEPVREASSGVPLIVIEDPYSASGLMPPDDDVQQLTRLETLIRRQMEQR